jgi:RNA polymerase sigma factor (sigma-70 family)
MERQPQDPPTGPVLESWTRLLAEGDEAAWRWFHHRYYFALLRYAAHRSGNASAAAEIVQNAYLRIARHAKPFAVEADLWQWLCCIVRCVALDHLRHVTRRSRLMEKFAHWRDAASGGEPEHCLANHQTRALTDEALEKLPAEDAALLRRKYCEGDTTEELATTLGQTPKAMEHRLARLRGQLRDILLRLE